MLSDDISNFSFISGGRHLRASGLFQKVDTPAADGHEADSQFCRTITESLEKARLAGQENPIIVGAIPFDCTQPSCLYIPQQYEWHPHQADKGNHAATIPELVSSQDIPGEHSFKSAVAQAIDCFRQGEIQKAVLSAQRELTFKQDVDVRTIRDNLLAQNSHGYFFQVPLSTGGALIGVSPELLIHKQDSTFTSNPLAGSARRLADPQADQENADRLAASEKDHYEHHLVTQAISAQLGGLCSALQIPEQPSLTSTATLWHLSTHIEGTLTNPQTSALQLACRLHPTPAVCGSPTTLSQHLIRTLEPSERGLFTGMVGWCDSQGNGEWVVTIRCGTIEGNQVRLFAGAGIVEASNPDSEWAEVQTKLGTMLHACGLPS